MSERRLRHSTHSNRHEDQRANKREQLLVEKSFSRTDRLIRRGAVKRASFALLAFFAVGSALGNSEPPRIRITTWNLEWFPNGSAHDATPEKQGQRIAAAADVLRPIDPDIILLQECGITKRALASVKPSRRECTTSQFALRSKNHSKADSVNSRWRFYPNIQRKPHGQNAGSR